MNSNSSYAIQKDEIDLRELFKTLIKHKTKIILITLVVTLVATVYALMKNPTPIYQGKVLVEIGEIQSENFGTSYFDNPNNLSAVISTQFKNLSASTPRSTNKLLELATSNSNKDLIKRDLNKAVSFILDRHKEKANFYSNYIMTKQIGDINIDDSPINAPKKKLIIAVAFITGLILSIFLVFFLEFLRNEKEHLV
ncbi:Wzz/FepE/Etk N-terminal domain-containing protein [Sulfurimonas sp.]|uniref:Wzz/FepE/Etk N-terminal domain-containing protein n=1 Tax=Sulfurimonas sp. TaxID=2022749 RepID=UPI0025EB3AFC|nr:Wzz/FepE/Etk N-terminal domain-containing protein [Sulfurimonas sp.]MCK9454065.1 Wzz/FepE/Etk N-terminal domain-containing protein [Sulfurimonas sp.]